MSVELDPDQAVQKWRDQIEENNRLQHVIADRDDHVEELARLNAQALFEASRYKALYDAMACERDYLQRFNAELRAKLTAVATVANEVAHTIEMLGTMAVLAATTEPPPAVPQTSPQPAELGPAPARAEAPAVSHVPIEDEPMDLPMFLQAADHPLLPRIAV